MSGGVATLSAAERELAAAFASIARGPMTRSVQAGQPERPEASEVMSHDLQRA
jgi:hypothetical protein